MTLATLALSASAFAGARAELTGSLAAGQATQLDVTVDGDATQPPDVQITGAHVRLTGQMSETSIINGAASHQTKFTYTVIPTAAGALDIPAIAIATSAGTQTTAPVHATVSASAAPAAATAATSSHVVESSSHAFITLDVPSRTLVVGQAVPVTIRAYFRAGTSATLDGAPQLTTDAFTLSNLSDKPTQHQVELHGEPYLQATWTALLSPAKPSAGKLAVELPVELAYRAAPRPAQHRTLRDLFGDDGDLFGDADPFGSMNIDVDSMFDIGPMQQQQVTLRGPTSTITVVEPPAAGRPADYTGAVGAFSIAVDPPTGTPRVGEPLTLAFHVTGTGNFDRVAGIGAVDSPGLRTYPAKADFVAGATAVTGTKTFTQTIVPVRAGSIDVPSVAFSYFDPVKHGYVTAHTAAIPLAVAASPGGGAADPGLAASVREPGMLPNRVDPGDRQASLTPLVHRGALWLGVGAIALATLLATLLAWSRGSRRIADVLAALRVDREITHATDAMKRAAIDNDQTAFFTAARRAFQVRLASTWHTRADAITAHDVVAHLGEGAHGYAIREVFEYADGMAYGVGVVEPLDYWDDIIRAELAHLEVSP
ncbi:MAG: BatD family protein [Kofleriaceae bacterium]